MSNYLCPLCAYETTEVITHCPICDYEGDFMNPEDYIHGFYESENFPQENDLAIINIVHGDYGIIDEVVSFDPPIVEYKCFIYDRYEMIGDIYSTPGVGAGFLPTKPTQAQLLQLRARMNSAGVTLDYNTFKIVPK